MAIVFVALGGFLGAGKTTTLLRLAAHWTGRGKRVAVIANDQADRLVDTDSFRGAGLTASEVAGGCFCCRFDDLVARGDELIASVRPDIILAEPVGGCTDLVATVLRPLRELHGDCFAVAPFAVVVDPLRALKVLGRTEPVGLSERVTYIYRMQQLEADLVAVNKIDLLSDGQRAHVEALVREQLPGRDVLLMSARTGEGVERLVTRLEQPSAGDHALTDIDYDIYAAGEAELGWMNGTIRLTAPTPLPLDDTALEFARELANALTSAHLEIAHVKLSLASGDDRSIVNVPRSDGPPELSHRSGAHSSAFDLVANLRVQAEPDRLNATFHGIVAEWAERLGITIVDGAGQCFSPGRPVPTHRIVE